MQGVLESEVSGPEREGTVRWLLRCQDEGFHGRPHKPDDTCYAFWVGAALVLLGAHDLVDAERLMAYVCSTQHPIVGGMAKWPDHSPGRYAVVPMFYSSLNWGCIYSDDHHIHIDMSLILL